MLADLGSGPLASPLGSPLGVQQTLFVRRKLNVQDAFLISRQIPPERGGELLVWNHAICVSTPQTFYNNFLSPFSGFAHATRRAEKPVQCLRSILRDADFAFRARLKMPAADIEVWFEPPRNPEDG